jgi:predicted signal transduction protein with EAL and GGDEF domain
VDRLPPDEPALADIAEQVPLVPATAAVLDIDQRVRRDLRVHTFVVVGKGPEGEASLGVIEREAFLTELAGPFGYGRALHSRTQVGELADWQPLVLPTATPVSQAARALLNHPGRARSVLLCRDEAGDVRAVRADKLFERTSAVYARRAMEDPLTGLANRAGFLQALTDACQRPGAERLVACYVDVDQFKAVNDTYGHAAGDQVLRAMASRLRAAARPQDVVARLGGDEFAVLLSLPAAAAEPGSASTPGTPTDGGQVEPVLQAQVQRIATRLLDVLCKPVAVGGQVLLGRVSIGVAICPPGPVDPDFLLREADTAMYEAKRAGGQRVVLHDGARPGEADGLLVSDEILRAVEEGQFVLHYQPIIEAGTWRLRAVEALVRWQHPRHGLLSPAAFVPAAEGNGTILALGRWVLEAACAQLAEWDAQLGPAAPPVLNVNLSVRQLTEPHLADWVEAVLRENRLAPHRLHLELPEGATLSQLKHVDRQLRDLRALGVRLTLDDMGAGSSTLRHATYLDVDGLKIDRELVGGMVNDERDYALVKLLIDLATRLGIPVTAEGVETLEQAHTLAELGCSLLQGFYFGRPEPVARLTTRLARPPAGWDLASYDERASSGDRPSYDDRASSYEDRAPSDERASSDDSPSSGEVVSSASVPPP